MHVIDTLLLSLTVSPAVSAETCCCSGPGMAPGCLSNPVVTADVQCNAQKCTVMQFARASLAPRDVAFFFALS